MKVQDREKEIVKAYLAATPIPDMEKRFGVGRSTIYHILRRTGTLPNRTKRVVDAAARDATLAGLYELIQFQDRRIAELEDELAKLRPPQSTNGRRRQAR